MLPASSYIDINLQVAAGVPAATIRRWIQRDRRRLGLVGGISLATVTPTTSRRWNWLYRRRRRPTNILTFVEHPKGQRWFRGEIILCPAVIRREARRNNYAEYLRFLIRHGLIHLLGLEHQTATQQKRWEKMEQRFNYDKN